MADTSQIVSVKGKVLVGPENNWLQDILEHITTVVHVLALGLTLFIVYLCFLEETFSLRTWHVFLYTVGVSKFSMKYKLYTKQIY